jgi:hypothetical protein
MQAKPMTVSCKFSAIVHQGTLTFSYRSALSPKAAKTAAVQASSLAGPAKYKNASVDRSSSWNATTRMSASGAEACLSVSASKRMRALCSVHAKGSLHLSGNVTGPYRSKRLVTAPRAEVWNTSALSVPPTTSIGPERAIYHLH